MLNEHRHNIDTAGVFTIFGVESGEQVSPASGRRNSHILKMIVIRNAEKSEAESLSALAMRSKAHWGYSEEFMDACRQELLVTEEMIERDANYYAVAEKEGVTVGFYALTSLSDSNIELDLLFVEPNHIRSGVGRMLFEHARNYAAANGGRTLFFQGDPNAEGFYRAMGARLAGTQESFSIPGRFIPTFSVSLVDEDVV